MKLARAEITLASGYIPNLKEGKFSGISGVSFSSQQYLVTRQSPSPWLSVGLSLGWVALLPSFFQSHLKTPITYPHLHPRTQHTPVTPSGRVSLIVAAQDLETTARGTTFSLRFNELLFTYNKNERSWIFPLVSSDTVFPKPRCRNPCYSPKAPLCPF